MSTGIPISSSLTVTPTEHPGHGYSFILELNAQTVIIDGPLGEPPPQGAVVLSTSRANPALPEGMTQIPFPPEKNHYFILRIENCLFAGAAPSAFARLPEWETLTAKLPPETLLFSSGLPPMTLGAHMDRLRAAC